MQGLPPRMPFIPTQPMYTMPLQYGATLYHPPMAPTMPQMRPQQGAPGVMNIAINPLLQATMVNPMFESKKLWIGKIPENTTDAFILKLLETCGSIQSWKRLTNPKGKLNSFGICEYVTVESMLKCLRLLNGFKIDDSELQIKIGTETEAYLKKWRECKKLEWIDSYAMRGLPLDPKDIKEKEDKGEPLEWELELLNRDQETMNQIKLVVNQRKEIDDIAAQQKQQEIITENANIFKDLKDLAEDKYKDPVREVEREKRREDKRKNLEKNFKEGEKRWMKRELEKLKEIDNKRRKEKDKDYYKHKKQTLVKKDLEYDSEKEQERRDRNPRKYDEYLYMRRKEKEYDEKMRKRDNEMIFKNTLTKSNNEIVFGGNSTALVNLPKEPEAKTKIEIQEYKGNNEDKEKKELLHVHINEGNDIKINIGDNNISNNNKIKDEDNKGKKDDIDEHDEDMFYSGKKNIDLGNLLNPETEKVLLDVKRKDTDEKNSKNNKNNENKIENKKKNIYTIEVMIGTVTPSRYKELQKEALFSIPRDLEDLLKYKVNWEIVNDYKIKTNKIKPWIEKKVKGIIDDIPYFVNLILGMLGEKKSEEILEMLKTILSEEGEVRNK